MSETQGRRYGRVPRLPWRQLDGQTVIVDPRRREVHVLNGTGSAIWQLLEAPRTAAELVAALEKEGTFDADTGAVEGDTRAFLEELAGKGLVAVQ